jgi:hypothetical protein
VEEFAIEVTFPAIKINKKARDVKEIDHFRTQCEFTGISTLTFMPRHGAKTNEKWF